VKVDGKRAYDYARDGQEIELKPKLLVIDEIEVLDFTLPFLKIVLFAVKELIFVLWQGILDWHWEVVHI
jgi:tRNA U55 pseudouridine synthase TruB